MPTLTETQSTPTGGDEAGREDLVLNELEGEVLEAYVHATCVCINHEGIKEGKLPVSIVEVGNSIKSGDIWHLFTDGDKGTVLACGRLRPSGYRVWVEPSLDEKYGKRIRKQMIALLSHKRK